MYYNDCRNNLIGDRPTLLLAGDVEGTEEMTVISETGGRGWSMGPWSGVWNGAEVRPRKFRRRHWFVPIQTAIFEVYRGLAGPCLFR